MKILMQWMMAANLPYQTEAVGDDSAWSAAMLDKIRTFNKIQ